MKEKNEPADDADRLREWFARLKLVNPITKAAFATRYKIPGGASMVSQHLSRNRPLSLEAVTAYASGFSALGLPCSIADLSPEHARSISAALPFDDRTVREPQKNYAAHHVIGATLKGKWPFKVASPEQVASLTPAQLDLVEGMIMQMVGQVPASKQQKPAKKAQGVRSA